MTPDELRKTIHDAINLALQDQLPIAVQTAVDVAVNGKIKALSAKMDPVVEAYSHWVSWKRVSLVVVGVFLSIGAFIQSTQTLWGAIAAHLTVK